MSDSLMPEQARFFREIRQILGDRTQIDKTIEECLELALALQHFKLGKVSKERVIQEIADVQIMSSQMAQFFGESDVAAVRRHKLERLSNNLDDLRDRCA